MNRYEKIFLGMIVFLTIGLIIFLNIDHSGHKMKFEEDRIIVNIDNIYIKDIQSVELLDDVFIGNKIKGTNTFTYLRGEFRLGNDTKGKVYVYNKSKPYIRIMAKDKVLIYNDKDSNETKETYNKLLSTYDISKTINVKKNVVSKDSKVKYNKKDSIIEIVSIMPVVIILVGTGIYSFKRKTPMHFWSGTTVKSEEISDIYAYNKANGIMWIVYGLSYLLILPIGVVFGEAICAIITIILATFGLVALIICYKLIYKKYKVK